MNNNKGGGNRVSTRTPRFLQKEEKEDTHRMAEANKAFAHYQW